MTRDMQQMFPSLAPPPDKQLRQGWCWFKIREKKEWIMGYHVLERSIFLALLVGDDVKVVSYTMAEVWTIVYIPEPRPSGLIV